MRKGNKTMITGRDLIQKLYSESEKERTFSVEMDEETLSLFSDFCEELGVDLKLYSKEEEDEEYNRKVDKFVKKSRLTSDIRTGIVGAAGGAAVGAYASPLSKFGRNTAIGATLGAGIGAGLNHLVHKKLTTKNLEKLKEKYLNLIIKFREDYSKNNESISSEIILSKKRLGTRHYLITTSLLM